MTIRAFEDQIPRVAASAYVDPTALVVGDVAIGEDASIWPMAVVRGDVQAITIGARSNVQDGSVLHVTHDGPFTPGGAALILGADVVVGHRAVLHGCIVEDRCLVGMAATVMDGAVVGAGSMLAAGSLVPPGRRLEGGWLYVGSPVRQARPLTERERAFLEYSPAHYVRLKDRHLSRDR